MLFSRNTTWLGSLILPKNIRQHATFPAVHIILQNLMHFVNQAFVYYRNRPTLIPSSFVWVRYWYYCSNQRGRMGFPRCGATLSSDLGSYLGLTSIAIYVRTGWCFLCGCFLNITMFCRVWAAFLAPNCLFFCFSEELKPFCLKTEYIFMAAPPLLNVWVGCCASSALEAQPFTAINKK